LTYISVLVVSPLRTVAMLDSVMSTAIVSETRDSVILTLGEYTNTADRELKRVTRVTLHYITRVAYSSSGNLAFVQSIYPTYTTV